MASGPVDGKHFFTFFTLKPQRKGSLMTGPFPTNSPTTEQPTVENVLVDK